MVEELRKEIAERMEHLHVVPVLRGVSHLVAFIVSVVSGTLLVARAAMPLQTVASLVYSVGLSAALATSAAYHRFPWAPDARRVMRKVDHSMIFVLVASSYTPMLLLALDGGWRIGTMVGVWILASGGVIMRLTLPDQRRSLYVAAYLGLGWGAVLLLPKLYHALGDTSFDLLVIGGLLYTCGAVTYLFKWPNPHPRWFGFHEVFHAFVVVAAACHYLAVWPLVTTA